MSKSSGMTSTNATYHIYYVDGTDIIAHVRLWSLGIYEKSLNNNKKVKSWERIS